MNDAQLLRYARHIMLDDVGIAGQERILAARALVVGAGGLGSPELLYLASAGVGHITVVDPDTVDVTNLQRQIAHSDARVGQPKAHSAATAMQQLNPDVRITSLVEAADAAWLQQAVPQHDVVLDCSDNFATRQAINAACVQHRVPLVSGAAIRMDGQVSVFDSRLATSPCYACVFPSHTPPEETQCATLGVLAPLVGIIGSTQAAQALLLLAQGTSPLVGKLLMLDARTMEWTTLQTPRNPHCPVCGHTTDHVKVA